MTPVIDFMASMAGRIFRGVVGIILLVIATQVAGVGMWLLYVFGVFFLAVGIFDVCVLAPLFGLPFTGKGIRGRQK